MNSETQLVGKHFQHLTLQLVKSSPKLQKEIRLTSFHIDVVFLVYRVLEMLSVADIKSRKGVF